MEELKCSTSLVNRPGGFVITDRAIAFCSFQSGAKLIDLGCGSGATVNYLIEKYGFEVHGLDKKLDLLNTNRNLIRAAAEKIPFPSLWIDGVLMECSFSLMDNQSITLKECYRVLKDNGRLIITDIYARGKPATLDGCLGRLDRKETLISLVENNGFKVKLFEDYTHHLQTMWGQMIMDKGAQEFYCSLGVNPEVMKLVKCGYCLIVAVKM